MQPVAYSLPELLEVALAGYLPDVIPARRRRSHSFRPTDCSMRAAKRRTASASAGGALREAAVETDLGGVWFDAVARPWFDRLIRLDCTK